MARGILFSEAMVAALLAGSKTQTRRALRPQPEGGVLPVPAPRNPLGAPGDLLWVRERFAAFGHWQTRLDARKGRDAWFFTDLTRASGQDWRYGHAGADGERIAGAAPAWHRRPALFMPRAASRIALEIVAVRIERLQAIGVADALAEGVAPDGDPVAAYRAVWERINGVGSWHADPLVWVVTFAIAVGSTKPSPPQIP